MKLRLPIAVKILCWFFANLLLLSILGIWFLQTQLNAGFDTLLTRSAGDRVRALRDSVQGEIFAGSREDINEILERFSSNFGVTLYLFRRPLRQNGGPEIEISGRLEEWIEEGANNFPEPRQKAVGAKGPRAKGRLVDLSEEERALRDLDRLLSDAFPEKSGPQLKGALSDDIRYLRTANPRSHWVSIPLILPAPEFEQRSPGAPSLFVIQSETLAANGLLFDARPWVLAGVTVVAVCVVFWLPLVINITRYLRKMTLVTEAMANGEFDQKIDTRPGDELGRLGRAINRLSGRLGNYVHGQRRFLGDIAHELCSPIARIQMALGILQQREHSDYVDGLSEDTRQLSDLVNELLEFSKASLRPDDVQIEAVPVVEVIREVVEREKSGYTGVDLDIDIDIETDTLEVRANRELLGRSLANLVRNALRYASSDGPIEITALNAAGEVSIAVRDQGPGIPEGAIDHVFDPFFRPDTARTRESGGVGLGLAIVKTCVEACSGRISCRNIEPHGLEVILYFPSALYFQKADAI